MCAVCGWVIFSLIQCDCFILNSVQCGRFILVCSLVVLQNSQCVVFVFRELHTVFGAHSGEWAVRVKKVQSEMCAVSPAVCVCVCVHCSVCCTRCSRFVGSQLVLCRQTHIYIGDLAVAALGKTDRHAHTNRQMNTHEPNSWTSTNTQTHKPTNTQTHKHTNTQTHRHTNTQTDEYARAKHCWRHTQRRTSNQHTYLQKAVASNQQLFHQREGCHA